MKSNSIKHLLFALSLLCFAATGLAQTASVKGKISLSTGTNADNVSVTIKNTQIGTVTDTDGNYEIKNLKPGNYVLRVSLVGFSSKEKNITLQAGSEIVENFELASGSEQLAEVTIENGKTNKFARKESVVVSKMPLKNLENPQVYTTISGELLKEQVVTNIDDALKNAPGLSQLWVSTGRGGDGSGYYSLRGFAVQPTMVNGLPGLTNSSLDPQNIERIEVIKGPSGTLFGSSLISYGGLININTKRPYNHFGGEISYISGSYGLNRLTADVNVPLDSEHKMNFRLNSSLHKEDSFQDAGFRKSFFVAPSLSFEANDRLSFLVNAEILNWESTNPTMLFFDRNAPLRVHDMNQFRYDNKKSYTSNQLTLETPSYNLQGQMFYKLSSKWTSQTVLSRSSQKSQGYYSYLYEGSQFLPITEGVTFARYFNYQNSTGQTTDIQQNFIGDFKIGQLRNRIVAGLDYFNRTQTDNSSGYVQNGFVYVGNSLDQFNAMLGITDPTQFVDDSGDLTKAGSDALLEGAPINISKSKQDVYSVYASDVLNITPALSAMVSGRIDRFFNYIDAHQDNPQAQTTFSPKFGLVYQPILDKVSVFANYMDGFTNTAPSSDRINGVNRPVVFDPEHAKQFEIGTKVNLMGDKITASLSYFDIRVTDAVYSTLEADPDPNDNIPGDLINHQDGAQKNRGFEADVQANPIEGLNLVFGYSYVDSRLTQGDADFVGNRPESAGPRNLVNFWASYKFRGKLDGFGIGFGGNYADKNRIMNRNYAGTFTLPSYTVLNSSLFYTKDRFTLTLKVDNIANKDTYDGWSTVHPRNMRSVLGGLTYKF
ncbi:TonB-dependent receptor [Flavobacterium sp. MAH-1]|uniref:TonB-dependent receptor n=1 Tax=Flavobacterium agri TaxID=2743471 RepID=A0A7Y8Y361_9FLAO|nr:TonB-dependent receptor [Flavobacterium agri]NUY80405.1 TonB-dependent receptor [Flavobacterium agri]NYA70430.1 TonB-dependent receptor [Flavobacterium agri]